MGLLESQEKQTVGLALKTFGWKIDGGKYVGRVSTTGPAKTGNVKTKAELPSTVPKKNRPRISTLGGDLLQVDLMNLREILRCRLPSLEFGKAC